MSDLHHCAGVTTHGNKVMVCACVSKQMYQELDKHFRSEFIGEVQAFASEYHHHIDGRDVVIVEQLLDFLTPVETKEEHGLGSS